MSTPLQWSAIWLLSYALSLAKPGLAIGAAAAEPAFRALPELLACLVRCEAQEESTWPSVEQVKSGLQNATKEALSTLTDEEGNTLLYYLLDHSAYHPLLGLLPEGSDLCARCGCGCTPLQLLLCPRAASLRFPPADTRALLKLLLEQGADPNPWPSRHASPLHMALDPRKPLLPSDRLTLVEALAGAGADLQAWNKFKQTPLEVVLSYPSWQETLAPQEQEERNALVELALLLAWGCAQAMPGGQTPLQRFVSLPGCSVALQYNLVVRWLAQGIAPHGDGASWGALALRFCLEHFGEDPLRMGPLIAALLGHGADPAPLLTTTAKEPLWDLLLPCPSEAEAFKFLPWTSRLALFERLLKLAPPPLLTAPRLATAPPLLHRLLTYPSASCPPAIRYPLLHGFLRALAPEARQQALHQPDAHGRLPLHQPLLQSDLRAEERLELAGLLLVYGARPSSCQASAPGSLLDLLASEELKVPPEVREGFLKMLLGKSSPPACTTMRNQHGQTPLDLLEGDENALSPKQKKAWGSKLGGTPRQASPPLNPLAKLMITLLGGGTLLLAGSLQEEAFPPWALAEEEPAPLSEELSLGGPTSPLEEVQAQEA